MIRLDDQTRPLYLWDPETTFVRKSPLTFQCTVRMVWACCGSPWPMLVNAAEQEIKEKTKHRKYTYQMNRNMKAGLLQHFLYHIYLDGPSNWSAKTKILRKLIASYTEPYRSQPERQRKRKIMRAQHRHTHDRRRQQRS